MLKRRTRSYNFFVLAFLVSLFFSSCVPQRKLTYLQAANVNLSQTDTTTTNIVEREYKLKPKDEVYIKVNSIDPTTYQFFNGDDNTKSNNLTSDLALYLNSYMLDDSGNVSLPVAGKICLSGLTMSEGKQKLEDVLKKYLTDVSVTLKLTGFKITLLGEIKRPGRHLAYVTQLNVLEAIALGGDLTEFGNRQKVMIIREVDGKQCIFFINLLDRNLITDKNFNLLPNDIIYVEALKAKTYGFSQFPYALVFSSVSTLVALVTLLKIK